MTCTSKIEGNPACATCVIKNIIRQDDKGSNYLQKGRIPRGILVTSQPKDSWAGRPSRQIVRCSRELGIPVE